MKKNILLKLLSALSLSSCSCKGCEVRLLGCNTWYDFNTKENNYYDCKMNLSVYLDQYYFVFGVILGENTTCTIHFEFNSDKVYNSNVSYPLDYYKVVCSDSTGEIVHFNVSSRYTIRSSRTIKFDYSNWDEDIKKNFNDSLKFRFNFFDDGFIYSKSDNESRFNKVDFGDDLSKVDIEKMFKLTDS